LPAAARHRPETCSPNACPDVSKAVQPIPRVPASLLQAYRCGTQAASREVCLCLCVRRAACLMGGPCQPRSWGRRLVGASKDPLPATSILLAYLPSASSLSCMVCAFIFLSSFVCRLETSEMSLASEHAVRATLSALLLEESTPFFHAILFCRRPRTHQSRF
jgi:hypothetical protein